jgi:uncharacterized circularly permuted ATP-grasp superfamily protein
MSTMLSVRELPPDEQVRMTIDEAGEKYSGHFIFFTNSKRELEDGRWQYYVIPRIIALNSITFLDSGLSKKYKDRKVYGVPFSCTAYMAEDQIPPVLAF